MVSIPSNIINNVFHGIWLYLLLLNPRYSKAKTVSICFFLTAVYELVCLYAFYSDSASRSGALAAAYFMGFPVFMAPYVFVLSADKYLRSVFIFVAYLCTWLFITYGSIAITFLFPESYYFTVMNSFRIVSNVGFILLYMFVIKKRLIFLTKNMDSGYGALAVVSLLTFLLLSVTFIFNLLYSFSSLYGTIEIILAFALTVSIYVVIFRSIVQQIEQNRLTHIEDQNLLLKERIETYELIESEASRTRHDFRHHNMTVLEYAKSGDCAAIIDYLREYETAEESRKQKRFSANNVINNIVSVYSSRAERNDIIFNADIRIKKDIHINDTDITVILANILENALNACKKFGEQCSISISIFERSNKLVILCENSCGDDICFENGIPKSKEHEGIGISSILASAEKYAGDAEFSAADGIFTCHVILNENIGQIK